MKNYKNNNYSKSVSWNTDERLHKADGTPVIVDHNQYDIDKVDVPKRGHQSTSKIIS